MLIRGAYSSSHGEVPVQALDKELTTDFEVRFGECVIFWRCLTLELSSNGFIKQLAILLWTLDLVKHDAYFSSEAIKRFTSSNWVLMEIACTRFLADLFLLRQVYHQLYIKFLEDVSHYTVGDFHKKWICSTLWRSMMAESVPLDKAFGKDTRGDREKMLLALVGHEDA
ncbi:hypothetical protein Nepgr_007882 [Nepenthes gracilis]|uniref:Uncharacterized protein n=1 Tax=Nepenthes gracilis TaxID=150966 RepID=A0AAD3XIP1_NEPGR|nr:hypothetical protein Nepgr_007882 [Nepenthes gracilis]